MPSNRAEAFLRDWVARKFVPGACDGALDDEALAEELAESCIDDAVDARIPAFKVSAAAGDDLQVFMLQALKQAALNPATLNQVGRLPENAALPAEPANMSAATRDVLCGCLALGLAAVAWSWFGIWPAALCLACSVLGAVLGARGPHALMAAVSVSRGTT